MIKRILVGIDTSEHSRTAQTYAFHLARRLGATLIGVHVVDIVSIEGSFFHDISGSLGLEPYLDFSSKMREILNARGKVVLEDFAQAARRGSFSIMDGFLPAWREERTKGTQRTNGTNNQETRSRQGNLDEGEMRPQ